MLPPQCRNRFWKWESKNSCLLVNLQKSLLLVKKLLQSKLPKSFLTIFRKLENLSTIWKKYPNILHHFKTHGFTRVGRILAVMSTVQDFRGPGISDIDRVRAYIEGSMFNFSKIFYVFHFDWFGRINFQHHVTYFIRLFTDNGQKWALFGQKIEKMSHMTDTNLHVLHSVVHDWQWKNTPTFTYIMLLIVHAMCTLIAL